MPQAERKSPASAKKRSKSTLTHVDADGRARMVDVGGKPVTERSAAAEGFVRMSQELAARIRANSIAKGSVLDVARLAGIVAAKRTDELIPLCHTLPLDAIEVSVLHAPVRASKRAVAQARVRVVATARTRSSTGVEMEALTAVAVACLTIVDMGKAVDKSMVIEGIRVLEKRGGRSGTYRAKRATHHGRT
jgi:cyclic pyranopterin phosphate synthase